ncbi:hypothetical protein [Aureibacillus halotolerans]|uniref:Damage-inducible protein DinB n=1 Tax=Aureibacillus halotolerans TaxID=1508390 RepID=A0A4R6TU22_9BACI|nr:hypothetical protein [Aureibacillus halotolerans]TDQ37200.1 hypothetical protein EV213_11479 [Aureibacillus halotolerans]
MNPLHAGLDGQNAHVNPAHVFDGVNEQIAGRAIYGQQTIWQLLTHMIFWQEYVLSLCHGKQPEDPVHATDTWVSETAPQDQACWEAAVHRFKEGLTSAIRLAQHVKTFDEQATHLNSLVAHNSYHAGQVAYIRKCLNAWPPPQGGATW